jgi:hypothetical protein
MNEVGSDGVGSKEPYSPPTPSLPTRHLFIRGSARSFHSPGLRPRVPTVLLERKKGHC